MNGKYIDLWVRVCLWNILRIEKLRSKQMPDLMSLWGPAVEIGYGLKASKPLSCGKLHHSLRKNTHW